MPRGRRRAWRLLFRLGRLKPNVNKSLSRRTLSHLCGLTSKSLRGRDLKKKKERGRRGTYRRFATFLRSIFIRGMSRSFRKMAVRLASHVDACKNILAPFKATGSAARTQFIISELSLPQLLGLFFFFLSRFSYRSSHSLSHLVTPSLNLPVFARPCTLLRAAQNL